MLKTYRIISLVFILFFIIISFSFFNAFSDSRFGELTEMRDERMRGKDGLWVRPHPGPFIWNHIEKEKLVFIPQGFDKNVHYPRHTFQQKERKVLFIGLYEPSRGNVIKALLDHNIKVEVAGKNWMPFINAQNSANLKFLGEGLFNDAYAKAISSAHISLGLVSKRFPELHTTRTFEIPACGTVLVTERNTETLQFFNEDEVLFFSNEAEMVDKISVLLLDDEALQQISQKGHLRATTSGYDYQSQLLHICSNIGLSNND